jgi:hypothetical protein
MDVQLPGVCYRLSFQGNEVRFGFVTDCRKLKRTKIGGFRWHNVHTDLHDSRSAGSDVEVGRGGGTHLQRGDHISLHIFNEKKSCPKRCAVIGLLGLLFVLFNAAVS